MVLPLLITHSRKQHSPKTEIILSVCCNFKYAAFDLKMATTAPNSSGIVPIVTFINLIFIYVVPFHSLLSGESIVRLFHPVDS